MVEKFIVDRIEEGSIVLENENGEIMVISSSLVENMPNEGDILIKTNNIYKIDNKATKLRRAEIREKMKGMWAE